jgi:hypothetical protein
VTAYFVADLNTISNLFSFGAFLLFIYSMWGALDTWLGEDFNYIGISRLLGYVSRQNLARPEVRRRWFTMRQHEPEDKEGNTR